MSAFLKLVGFRHKKYSYERFLRNCAWCGIAYSDVTPRETGRCCSTECSKLLTVDTRMKRDGFKRTPEQNAKMKVSQRKTFDERNIGAQISKILLAKNAVTPHWTTTDDGRARLREQGKKQITTPATKRNMSLGAVKRQRTKAETNYHVSKQGKRPDLNNQYFRSRWEANFARIMNYEGKSWQFEPEYFELEDAWHYIPDFLVDGDYYEIKGRMTAKDEHKHALFRLKYPHLRLHIVGAVEYTAYRIQYKDLIPTWEG